MKPTIEKGITDLVEQRVRLEREALALEKEQMALERARMEGEIKGLNARFKITIFFSFVSASLLSMLCFAGGWLGGSMRAEATNRVERERRLTQALSQLGDFTQDRMPENVATNILIKTQNGPKEAHRNVSVMVIQ
jgi:hypothetical protein